MVEYCIGYIVGVISIIGAIHITERENRKKRLSRKSRTRLYHYDLNKKMHLPDCSQKRRG